MEAVTFLTEEHAQEPAQDAAAAEPSAWEGSAVGKQLPQSKSVVRLCSPLRFHVSRTEPKGEASVLPASASESLRLLSWS